jgi:toxin ParE1/3/4
VTYEIAKAAERDIKDIFRETLKTFGTHQLAVYEQIIIRGIEMICDDPYRPGSLDRSELALGVRLFHLELAAGRRGGAAHGLYYSTGRLSDGTIGTVVLRVLHEHMEPRYKVIRSLRGFTRPVTPPQADASDEKPSDAKTRPEG